MSPEIIEAVFRYSEKNNESLMLIASKNQIDWDGGYVNNWTTRQYMNYIKGTRRKYPEAKVYVCRDHCGPGFKNQDLKDVYKTIDSDIEGGFDLIHVDFCKLEGTHDDILKKSKKVIEHIKKKSPQTLIEVGTDENTGAFLNDVSRIKKEVEFFTNIVPVHFFVCQTGSLVREVNQVGGFNAEFIRQIRKIADKYGVYLKEHNVDYTNDKELILRKGLIDAINVAPQFGVIQTKLTIQKCLAYGIDFSEFLERAYKSNRWKKWLHKNTAENKFLCSIIAGHYVFADGAYKKIYKQINKYEDFREAIINEMMKSFKLYLDNL